MNHLEELLTKVKKTDPKQGMDGDSLLYYLPYDREHYQIFKHALDKLIPCKGCGNCCRGMYVSIKDHEVITIAERLGMKENELIQKYKLKQETTPNGFLKFIMDAFPCPFLKDNKCTIYDIRPIVCQSYPLYESDNKLAVINSGKCARGQEIKQAYIDFLQGVIK